MFKPVCGSSLLMSVKKKSQGFQPYSILEGRDSQGGNDYSVIGGFGGCEGHRVRWHNYRANLLKDTDE